MSSLEGVSVNSVRGAQQEEEEEEDDSDSNFDVDLDADQNNIDDELQQFRNEWQQELQKDVSGGPAAGINGNPKAAQLTRDEQAKYFFMQGVDAEQHGRLYEAIQFYRKAVQLVPDIETKVGFIQKRRVRRRTRGESESSISSGDAAENEEDLEDLAKHFYLMRVNDNENALCQPQLVQTGTHISALPVEVIVYIFKWVVSSHLDYRGLEQLALVCRGFYLCARDEELWRLICMKVWGLNCGRPSSYGSWRNMFIERPHVQINGCYISKMTYYRQGEKGLDNFYKPFNLVEYYRYVRFFPDGQMLMLTTPDNPYITVTKLRSKASGVQGLLKGYFKVVGDVITAVLKRKKTVDERSMAYYRFKRNRNRENQNEGEQVFHVEFLLKDAGRRRFAQLVWNSYSVHTVYKSTGQETASDFELTNSSYPPLIFSRVRSYTSDAEGILS